MKLKKLAMMKVHSEHLPWSNICNRSIRNRVELPIRRADCRMVTLIIAIIIVIIIIFFFLISLIPTGTQGIKIIIVIMI